MALDGYPEAELRCHTLTEIETPRRGGVQRYGWLHNLDHIPNEVVQILWIVDLVKDPQPTIRLVSPALCWSRTIDFVENQIFRFA